MATDPVCGMFVEERSAELALQRENRTYYFCSTACLEEFSAPAQRLSRLKHRLAVAWPLSVAVLLLTYTSASPLEPWGALLLASVVQFYPGLQFYRGTYDALRGRVWNMDILIAVGTTVAYGYSAAALILPSRLPPNYYFDASALIVTLILTGNYLEHLTRERARGALRALKELLPTTALLLRDGREESVAVTEIHEGDRIRVRPGGRFPTDGTIEEGRSAVNEALLTGESLPVERGPGEPVIAGAINGEGGLLVRATKVGSDTLLSQIGQLVTEAETSRVPLQQLADRIASYFVPAVLAVAAAAAAGWYLFGAGGTIALLVFVSVAITACPCAFGIATPAAIVVGTGRAAEEGVLFKGRDSLEKASRIDLVVTDKTGTLTRGRPAVTDVVAAAGVEESHLWNVAFSLEERSEHPLAEAVRAASRTRGRRASEVVGWRAVPGVGVEGEVAGVPSSVVHGAGSASRSLDLSMFSDRIRGFEGAGKTYSVVVEGGRPIGVIAFADPIAEGVREAVEALAREGIATVMVTGDHAAAARAIADAAGIHEVHSGVGPAGKLDFLHETQRGGRSVAFVGDGINDAPALAAADLGIAIGAGTDVAKEAGGVILVRSDFRGVAFALRVGRRTVRKVRGNLTWALGYNAVLLPIAAGALVPAFGLGVFGVLPVTGALAMALSSTSVVLNSLSLRLLPYVPRAVH